MNANAFSQKDYENETALRSKKTNPNKANLIVLSIENSRLCAGK